jgi:ABC-type multidrug transport system ATPase subunit
MIEISRLGKRFGRHWVLNGVDLRIKAGETVALFGGNGSGKSTLLKTIATLITPSSGSLKIAGLEADKNRRDIRKKIRFLAHERQLYGALSVSENLKLAVVLRGINNGEEETSRLISLLGLERHRDHPVSQLSEGLKKRTVLARLLLEKLDEKAELFLLDEPHPTLDTEGRKILDRLISDWKKEGRTILLASHDHDQTLLHADRLLILENGKISYDGPPK